ncbi:hypothetical protein Q7P37_007549 [Cladosporium fusiforme]
MLVEAPRGYNAMRVTKRVEDLPGVYRSSDSRKAIANAHPSLFACATQKCHEARTYLEEGFMSASKELSATMKGASNVVLLSYAFGPGILVVIAATELAAINPSPCTTLFEPSAQHTLVVNPKAPSGRSGHISSTPSTPSSRNSLHQTVGPRRGHHPRPGGSDWRLAGNPVVLRLALPSPTMDPWTATRVRIPHEEADLKHVLVSSTLD